MPYAGQTLTALVKLGKKPDDCWTWLGAIDSSGHASKQIGGRRVGAHRWIWEQLFGPIPKDFVVFSTCESKPCINPFHLACGTQADANRQSVQTKLLPGDVLAIKAEPVRNQATAEIHAERHEISVNTVRDIWRGDTWSRKSKKRRPKPSERKAA